MEESVERTSRKLFILRVMKGRSMHALTAHAHTYTAHARTHAYFTRCRFGQV